MQTVRDKQCCQRWSHSEHEWTETKRNRTFVFHCKGILLGTTPMNPLHYPLTYCGRVWDHAPHTRKVNGVLHWCVGDKDLLTLSQVNEVLDKSSTQVKDSGAPKTIFDTGGARDIPVGKGRFDLLTAESWTELAQHFEAGALKYADRNWEKGLPLSTFFNSEVDHLRDSFHYGKTDENHEAANLWNAWCYLTTLRRIQNGQLPCSLDNRPLTHEQKNHHNCAELIKNLEGES